MRTKWITNKNSQSFLIDSEDKYMERCLVGTGYQMKNWKFTQSLASPRGMALDIGASIGMNSINYADYFDRVVSIEPDPDVYECLLETLTANGCDRVETIRAAVGKQNARGNLLRFARATFGNCLEPVGYENKSRDSFEVDVITVDSLDLRNVTFIKIDVEGNEMAVLEGAEQTIARDAPVIQIEIKPQMLKRQLTTPQEIWNWLTARGYTPKHFAGDVKQPRFRDSGKFTANSKYGIEYRIEFDGIHKNLVDFWFVKQQHDKGENK